MASRHRNIPLSSMLVGSLAIVPAMAAVGVLLIMMATTQTAEARACLAVIVDVGGGDVGVAERWMSSLVPPRAMADTASSRPCRRP
jgi:hypothetical protein